MRLPRLRSSPNIFHPNTNRRMYRLASNGEMGEPCGMPRRLSRASVVRVFRPRSSVSSTGHSSYILIMHYAPINNPARHRLEKVGMRNAPEVVREVGVYDFRVATEQLRFHLDHRLFGISPG